MSITEILAVVGALSGISSITWNYMQWRQNRPMLKVSAGIVTMVSADVVSKNKLSVKLVNIGKRPINVTMICGKNSKTNFIINPKGLPITLQEAQSAFEIYSAEDYAKEFPDNKLIELYAIDNMDRKWPVSKKEIKQINLELGKME